MLMGEISTNIEMVQEMVDRMKIALKEVQKKFDLGTYPYVDVC